MTLTVTEPKIQLDAVYDIHFLSEVPVEVPGGCFIKYTFPKELQVSTTLANVRGYVMMGTSNEAAGDVLTPVASDLTGATKFVVL